MVFVCCRKAPTVYDMVHHGTYFGSQKIVWARDLTLRVTKTPRLPPGPPHLELHS
jgi:hypothetical protein